MFKDARGEGLYDVFPTMAGQINLTTTYPGVIRAFHRHKYQTDYWKVVSGNIEVCTSEGPVASNKLHYLDKNSPVLIIFPRIWHGFRVLGNEPATLLYYTTESYDRDNPDEERAPWNQFYSWVTENK